MAEMYATDTPRYCTIGVVFLGVRVNTMAEIMGHSMMSLCGAGYRCLACES